MASLTKIIDRHYTTGEVAKICKMSQGTIIKYFDKGYIKGFLMPPANTERRIPYRNLLDFMTENNIPLNFLEDYLGIDELPESLKPSKHL